MTKPGEPVAVDSLSPADTARWLLARWFYTPNRNGGHLSIADGTVLTSHAGGAFAESNVKIAHIFRVDSISLYRTLLRGLPAALAAAPAGSSPADGCAWLDPHQPQPSTSPLYQATLNPAAVLLSTAGPDGRPRRLVVGATPQPADVSVAMRSLAVQADRHRITVTTKNGKLFTLRIPAGAGRIDTLRELHRVAFDGGQLHGVVNSTDCWLPPTKETVNDERLDLLIVGKAGTPPSPVWQDVSGVDLPAQPGDGGWAWPKRDSPAARVAGALLASAYDDWQQRTATAFETALDSPSDEAIEVWTAAVWAAARAAFAAVAASYTTSSRYAPRYAVAVGRLTPVELRMTDPSASPTSTTSAGTAGGRDAAFVGHLRALSATSTAARAALRRGEAPALASAALPYLASWQLSPADRGAALLFCSLLARHTSVRDDRTSPLGRAAFRTLSPTARRDPSATGTGRRIVATQRQNLPVAHRSFTGLLSTVAAAPAVGVDWAGLWRTYRTWDSPDTDRRTQARHKLLLDFFGGTAAT